MMNNVSAETSSTNSIFRQYLLGESVKNIFIRLTVILSAIILVWCGIMFALIIHTKCQRKKQILKTSNTHHRLYESNSSLNRKRSKHSKRIRRYQSSSSLSSSTRFYSIRHFLSELKRRCGFWPSTPINDNSVNRTSSSIIKSKQPIENCSSAKKPQLVVESMARRSIRSNCNSISLGERFSSYHEADSFSGGPLKSLHSIEINRKSSIELNQNLFQLTEPKHRIHHQSVSFPLVEIKDDHSTTKRLQKLHQFNTKATLFFHPITRRLSNSSVTASLLPTTEIQQQKQQQQQHKPLLMISSVGELPTHRPWQQSSTDEPITTDGSRTSSSRHIPLVMITDTSSSNTNILELETFEDEHRFLGDIERRLSQELRASYRPRHST